VHEAASDRDPNIPKLNTSMTPGDEAVQTAESWQRNAPIGPCLSRLSDVFLALLHHHPCHSCAVSFFGSHFKWPGTSMPMTKCCGALVSVSRGSRLSQCINNQNLASPASLRELQPLTQAQDLLTAYNATRQDLRHVSTPRTLPQTDSDWARLYDRVRIYTGSQQNYASA